MCHWYPFRTCGGSQAAQFGGQVVFVFAVTLWVGVLSLVMFLALRATDMLCVDAFTEEAGLDATEHGGDAYEQQRQEDKLYIELESNGSIRSGSYRIRRPVKVDDVEGAM